MERQWNSGMEQPDRPHLFGIRHLSPSGAWHLRKFLDETDPDLVLIEGPSDFTELLEDLTKKEVKPPVAVMAYTSDSLPPCRLLAGVPGGAVGQGEGEKGQIF